AVAAGNNAEDALNFAKREETARKLAEEEEARAERQQNLAEIAADDARQAERNTRRHLYVANMNLAQRAWRDGSGNRVFHLLDATRPEQTGGEDLRGFEWDYLYHRTHLNLKTIETGQ